MKRPLEDSGGESDNEATKQSCGPSVSLEGGDVTSQGEEGNLPAMEMDVERGEGVHDEIGGQEESGEEEGEGEDAEIGSQEDPGEGGENQEQGEEEDVEIRDQEDPAEGLEDRGEEGYVEIEGQEELGEEEQGEREIPELREEGREEEMSRREAEEDLRFKDALDTRRSRQCEPKKVDSLQNLTLKCISDNTNYFLDHSEDIHSLPGPIFRLVANFLHKTDAVKCPEILSLIISEKTEKLHLYFGNDRRYSTSTPAVLWTPDRVANILSLIEQKCKLNLTELTFRVYLPGDDIIAGNRIFPVQINALLVGLKNLTILHIDNSFAITDDTLIVLGLNCKQLSHLNLFNKKQITDTGIDYLCAKAAPYGQCKNLETLELRGTSVTVDGLVTALSNLPKLANVKHSAVNIALIKFVRINGLSKQLQLRELDCSDEIISHDDLENICKITPHATSVHLDSCRNLSALSHLDALSDFFIFDLHTSVQDMDLFVTKFSTSLRSFTLFNHYNNIDISVFGLCPNIETLSLGCDILPTSQFQLLPDSFMKLKELRIDQDPEGGHTDTDLGSSCVMQMISSPSLQIVCLKNITLPEASLYSLIVEAKAKQKVFSNLELFYIRENEYSFETLIQLICVCPKLSQYGCMASPELFVQFKKFVMRNNLNTKTIGPC